MGSKVLSLAWAILRGPWGPPLSPCGVCVLQDWLSPSPREPLSPVSYRAGLG